MTPGEAIREYLSRQQPVTAIVGSKIFGDKAEENTTGPYIVYSMTANREPGHLTGISGLAQATLQINCWARKKADSERLREAVRNVLHTLRGRITTGAGESFTVRSARIIGSADAFVQDNEGSDTGDYSAGITFSMWHKVLSPSAV